MAFNLPPPLSTFRFLIPSPPPGKKKALSCYKGETCKYHIYLCSLSLPHYSLAPLSMSVIISFQWILTRKWAYLNGKISFSFRRWFSVFKAHGKDRQTVSSPSSKAMMLSAVSYNTDEWREVSGGWRDGSGGWKEGSIRWRDRGDSSEKSNQHGEGYERKRADIKIYSGCRRDEHKK